LILIFTDYSQVDARFSHGIDEFVEIEGIGDTRCRKILLDNCARLYNLWQEVFQR
jgi:hypothetical protein